MNTFATFNWHKKHIYSRSETKNIFIYSLKINQLHICITLAPFQEKTLQRWGAENTSLSNKLFKINCQNWGEENKTQHPNQNPTKLISSIIFAQSPWKFVHTHTQSFIFPMRSTKSLFFVFFNKSTELLFHYCSSSSHQLRVEKLSKFPQNDKRQ